MLLEESTIMANLWANSSSQMRVKNYSPNALLRGEQRNADAAVYQLKHLSQRIVKMPRVANPS